MPLLPGSGLARVLSGGTSRRQLPANEAGIAAASGQEGLVRAAFHRPTLVEHDDVVGVADHLPS